MLETIKVQVNWKFALSVKRIGQDWLARRCPSCGELGYVGIYQGRLDESVKFITSKTWVCGDCQKENRQNENYSHALALHEFHTCGKGN